MKKIKLLFIYLFTVITITQGQSKTDSGHPKFNPSADPFAEIKTAVAEAKMTHKRILLDVGGEWCIWCHRIDSFIEANEEIGKILHDNFVVLKINYSEENKNEKFLVQYPKVAGFPHFFVLEQNGKLLHSQNTGLLEKDKSYDPGKMLTFFKEWAPVKKKLRRS